MRHIEIGVRTADVERNRITIEAAVPIPGRSSVRRWDVFDGGQFLYFTEFVSMPVVERGRRIGRVRDAAIVPVVHPSRIDRLLVGGADVWLTVRFDQVRAISLGHGIELSEEVLRPLPRRRVHPAHRARPARPADHRRQRPESGPRHRHHHGISARRRARHPLRDRSGYRRAQHLTPRLAGRSAANLDPPPAAPHPAKVHPLGVRQRGGARSVAPPAPQHFVPDARGHAPGGPRGYRRGARVPPSAKPSSKPSTAK